jgi:glycerol-3-phosphate acyltransferase PlsX
MTPVIAVDAMGGDRAPAVVVDGVVQAAGRLDIEIALVGRRADLEAELARHGHARLDRIRLIDAGDVVAMHEAPLAALRRKPHASIRVAAELVRTRAASALFSAGHSGATVLAAHGALGMIAGIDRPALAVIYPTHQGAALLLDAGASLECRPDHLVQFARMGTTYARVAMEIERPRVGLLSIGEEAGKGTGLIRDTHARLAETSLNFIGNLEARDLFTGRADVVVCDGFTGNIALKVGEGLVDAVGRMLADELGAAVTSQIGARLTRHAFERFRQRVDYAEYGAAPLLGLAGLALVGHGRSSARAIENGIAMAAQLAADRMVERVSADFCAA